MVNFSTKLAYLRFVFGLYHVKLGEYGKAAGFFKEAVKLAPFFKEPRKYLGQDSAPAAVAGKN